MGENPLPISLVTYLKKFLRVKFVPLLPATISLQSRAKERRLPWATKLTVKQERQIEKRERVRKKTKVALLSQLIV